MGKKDDLIAKAQELGIELDSSETIADLEAKIAAHSAKDEAPEATEEVEEATEHTGTVSITVTVGSAAWAFAQLTEGKRIMREAAADNHHIDPNHIRGGVRMSYDDFNADDWKTV